MSLYCTWYRGHQTRVKRQTTRDRTLADNRDPDYHFRDHGTFAHRIRHPYNTLVYKWLLALAAAVNRMLFTLLDLSSPLIHKTDE